MGVALFDAGARADDGLGSDAAEVADDGGGLDDGAVADVAAVDHRARPDDDLVADHHLVVREEVQDRVLQDLGPRADPEPQTRSAWSSR